MFLGPLSFFKMLALPSARWCGDHCAGDVGSLRILTKQLGYFCLVDCFCRPKLTEKISGGFEARMKVFCFHIEGDKKGDIG